MGGVRNRARLWMITGAAVVVLLGLGGWFLLIGPKFSEAGSVRAQAADTGVQLTMLRTKLAALQKKQAQLSQLKAKLKASRAALPTGSGVPAFLRQLQASGDLTDVRVSALSVAAPVQTADVPGVWQLQMTLNAAGEPNHLSDFLDKVQEQQARGVLIQSVNLVEDTAPSTSVSSTPSATPTASPTTEAGTEGEASVLAHPTTSSPTASPTPTTTPEPTTSSIAGNTTLSLSLLAFVAPPAGSGPPVVTTK